MFTGVEEALRRASFERCRSFHSCNCEACSPSSRPLAGARRPEGSRQRRGPRTHDAPPGWTSIKEGVEQRAVTLGRIAVLIATAGAALNLVEPGQVAVAAEQDAATAALGLARSARRLLAARFISGAAATERSRRTLLRRLESGQVRVADLEVGAAAAVLAGLARCRRAAAPERVTQGLARARLLDVEAGAVRVANGERPSEAGKLSVLAGWRLASSPHRLEAELTERRRHALLDGLEPGATVIAALQPAVDTALLTGVAGGRRALGRIALERRLAQLLAIARRDGHPAQLVIRAALQLALVAGELARGARRRQALTCPGDTVSGGRALVDQLPAIAVRVAHLQRGAVAAQLVERARGWDAAGRRWATQGGAAADGGRDPASTVG